MTEQTVLDTVYDPHRVEARVYAGWEEARAFRSDPSPDRPAFAVVIPPPNVTGALHLGHALNNTLQDILVRYHRMRGFDTLWQPGTDHAGIATQAVVERRIRRQEGKSRHDIGREELVNRIWQWKDDYENRIIGQLKLMGCSCDWERTRFTLDDGLARAVRRQFYELFKDGLIFRGKRLVNWDTELQTAVANDEVYHETVKGHFWHFKYPVLDPKPGEPEHVIIATTRPETMLGDTAVAVHPDPEGFFEAKEGTLREGLAGAGAKERAELQAKLASLEARRESHLPMLIRLRDMALDGRKLMLPLVEREIPLIADEWADPTLGSGCVKITPAHDPNDYEVGVRRGLPMINVLSPDGKVARIVEPDGETNPHGGKYEGLTFSTDGRAKVVADLDALGLLDDVEDHETEIGHSDRSKTPIEPFLSDQWFVRTGAPPEPRAEEGGANGADPTSEQRPAGLAQAAIDVVNEGRVRIHPDRYTRSYLDWLGEKRDWCISRQLWWGHRISVWHKRVGLTEKNWRDHLAGQVDLDSILEGKWEAGGESAVMVCSADTGEPVDLKTHLMPVVSETEGTYDIYVFSHESAAKGLLHADGYVLDEDVLDTWFSSALWPFSTLGWPDETEHLRKYYPTSVLITSRDIITNWVARMVMFGLYAMGDIPFRHVYIHPKILDGRGETMSKSKGNGVDPVDIIHTHGADALRYAMADMTTETQDIRMPVEYVCPHCGKLVDQLMVLKVEEQARKSRGEKLDRKLQPADCTLVKCTHAECGKEFATKWAEDAERGDLPVARETSAKFDIGRNFANKLWNAARFAFINLTDTPCDALDIASLPPEDRWILAKTSQTIRRYHELIQGYQFSASVRLLREFFWDSLCDWYIELTKPRMAGQSRESDEPGTPADAGRTHSQNDSDESTAAAKQVLAFCLDQILRLFHPTIPFITEELWERLGELVPRRGLPGSAELSVDSLLALSAFPPEEGYPALDDEVILNVFAEIQEVVRAVRELRSQCDVSPKTAIVATVVLPEEACEAFRAHAHIVLRMANVSSLTVDPRAGRPANAGSITRGTMRVFVHDISDDQAERARAAKAMARLDKQIAGKESKLRNDKFLANARPEIVTAERERLEELVSQRTGLQAHLQELGGS